MDINIISFKTLLWIVIFSVIIIFISFGFSYTLDNSKIIFCDVGQGDAIYIRTSNRTDILIDSGRDGRVLTCLGKYMPIYDRTIELAFLTHPDDDHDGGYIEVLKRYKILNFYITIEGTDDNYQKMKKLAQNSLKQIYQGDSLQIGKAHVDIMWPTRNKLIHNLSTNESSYVMSFHDAPIKVLFTGDIGPESIHKIISTCKTKECSDDFQADILKVPHHGSKHGLTSQLLRKVDPNLSVISVGKNSYGHPSKEILELFHTLQKSYVRTDQSGDIVIEYNEKGWWVKEK
ncbi:MAG TPA: MBL fold metallo-hydrolase [Candidatus Nitrosocosmicus sp.]|nr:MBL fold metallo-hydrolase [Candidatus Nitrosocosmicus sp.]